jgi:hypothetical protein
VFNVAGNKYLVVAAIDYEKQIAWIRFVGTHPQYDQIDAETVRWTLNLFVTKKAFRGLLRGWKSCGEPEQGRMKAMGWNF